MLQIQNYNLKPPQLNFYKVQHKTDTNIANLKEEWQASIVTLCIEFKSVGAPYTNMYSVGMCRVSKLNAQLTTHKL